MLRRLRLGCGLVAALAVLILATVAAPAAQPRRQAIRRARNAKQSSSVPLRELEPAGITKFSTPGPGAVGLPVQCDANGNVYMNAGPVAQVIEDAREGIGEPLTKLSLGSGNTVEFALPAFPRYAERFGRGFYVTPRGDVYALAEAYRHKAGFKGANWAHIFVVKYDGDGTVDSTAELEPPQGMHLEVWKLAAFLDGNFLVMGFEVSGPHLAPVKPFTGIFDRGGGYVGPLVLPNDVTQPKHMPPPIPFKNGKPVRPLSFKRVAHPVPPKPGSLWFFDVQQSLIVGALDGTLYLMRATSPMRLYTISSTGTVLGEHLVKPPRPGMRPAQASLAGQGMLLMEFLRPATPQSPHFHQTYARVDPHTGKVVETYDVSPKAGMAACMDEQNELLFLRSSKAGRLEVAKYVGQ